MRLGEPAEPRREIAQRCDEAQPRAVLTEHRPAIGQAEERRAVQPVGDRLLIGKPGRRDRGDVGGIARDLFGDLPTRFDAAIDVERDDPDREGGTLARGSDREGELRTLEGGKRSIESAFWRKVLDERDLQRDGFIRRRTRSVWRWRSGGRLPLARRQREYERTDQGNSSDRARPPRLFDVV